MISVWRKFKKCAYVGRESDIGSAEPEALCCDGGATSSLSSSLMNCWEVTERVVPIQTAQGGTVMLTTHVCLKTYFVRDQTGELRPITTKTYCQEPQTRSIVRESAELSGISDCPWSRSRASRSVCSQRQKDLQIQIFCVYEWTLESVLFKRTEQLTSSLLGRCRVTSYGTEGWDIARTEIFGMLFIILQDWNVMHKKFEPHMKFPSCMIGKSTVEELPKLKDRATEPLCQMNMDSLSSSVTSIEG